MPDPEPDLARFFRRLVARPVAVLMGMVAILGLGVIATSRLSVELLPADFSSSRVWVYAPWSGANPTEIEKRVVRPLEEELRTISNVSEIIAWAAPGNCGVGVSFPGNIDMDMAYAEVADRVERVRPDLPRDVDRVFIQRWTATDLPIMWIGALYPPEMDGDFQEIYDDILAPRLEGVDGVANVDVHGIVPRSVRIRLNEDRVRAAKVDLGALVSSLMQDNVSAPLGDLDDAGSRFILRVDGRFKSLKDIEEFPVRSDLKIKDIGVVEEVREEPTSRFRVNGEYGVGMAVGKESSANTFEVCRRLKAMIEEEFPADPVLGKFKFKVFMNAGETIEGSLRKLVEEALLGGLIACGVLMIFLRRFRFTLLIALSIPFAVTVTLTFLYFAGDSFNLLSMMGITISVGMLVDNSVVIVESIFKRREQGVPLEEAVTRGPAEVALAVLTATLTSVVVFLPIIFMSEGRNNRIFAESIGLPLCVGLLAALGGAMFVVPVASLHLARSHNVRGPLERFVDFMVRGKKGVPGLLGRIAPKNAIPRMVKWSIGNRFPALLLASLFLMTLPLACAENEVSEGMSGFGGETEVDFDLSANTSFQQAEEEMMVVEKALLDPAFLEAIGNPDVGIQFSRRRGEVNIWHQTQPSRQREEEITELLKEQLPKRAAIDWKFEDRFEKENVDDEKWVRVALTGPDSEVVARLAEEVREAARRSGNFEEVAEEEHPNREVILTLDRERMQRVGINSQRVLGTIEWSLRGFMVSRLETGTTDLPIVIEFDESGEPDRSRLAELEVAEFAGGASLPLSTFADFDYGFAPRSVFRRDGRTRDVVGLKTKTEDLRERNRLLRMLMSRVRLPEGYGWEESGGLGEFQDDMAELMKALMLSVALVFFLMGLLFESILLPFTVLFTIPFAIVGALWSFKLSGVAMDLTAMVGLIVLTGVVVNNGIVLVDKIIRLRREGLDRAVAVVQGVRERVRPVLMTALTTICGLLPIALAQADGNGFSFKGLAVGVAGGLACSTFFTLWVVPLAYTLFDDLSVKLRQAMPLSAARGAAKI